MTDKINYVPTVIRWVENGKEQQRTINIQEGFKFDFSGKSYTAKSYNYNGKKPLLSLSKEDAYSLMGFSKLNDDSKVDNKGKKEYTLDAKDWDTAMQLRGSSDAGLLKRRISTLAPEAHTFKAQFGHDDKMNVLNDKFELNHVSIFFNKK